MGPEVLGFFGVVFTGIAAILVAQIQSRRKTEDVKQEVIAGKDSANEMLSSLTREMVIMRERMDDHIRWHLEESRHTNYIPPRKMR